MPLLLDPHVDTPHFVLPVLTPGSCQTSELVCRLPGFCTKKEEDKPVLLFSVRDIMEIYSRSYLQQALNAGLISSTCLCVRPYLTADFSQLSLTVFKISSA